MKVSSTAYTVFMRLLKAAVTLSACLWLSGGAALAVSPSAKPQTSSSSNKPDWPVNESATLHLVAKLTDKSEAITNGLVWRIFKQKPEKKDKLSPVKSAKGGKAEFKLPPGDYILHVAYGRAGIVKQIKLGANDDISEQIVLNAGGLKLTARLSNGNLDASQLKFSVYSDNSENNEYNLVVRDIKTDTIVRLNAGVYRVVCEYGAANAIVRADIKVQAGKLTETTIQQHAAQVSLKLTQPESGEELPDTTWAIMNDAGDIVREIANGNASVILAEGNYLALARNSDQTYQRGFSVTSGKNQEIDITATPENRTDEDMLD